MATVDTAGTDVRGMFDRIAGRYDAANRVMSAGIDVLWRRKALGLMLDGIAANPRILDLGAGTLDGALEIRRRRPDARVVAADFAREMLKVGRRKPGADEVATHGADGHRLPYASGVFDAAFSAFCVRNLRDLPLAMGELRRVVKPGGAIAILEFFRPAKPRLFFDKFYNAHLLPLVGWAVSGDREAYRYLPASIERFVSRPAYEELLRKVGFATVQGQDLFPSGVASLVVAR
jgi:demethylmenaquinone methyltransferase/2-methoxy-6-polyprenyl-1,4-benzoquinol methylase